MGKSIINLSTDNLIEKQETVRFDLNMNPLGIPNSVITAISNNINHLNSYPDVTYKRLKESISEYCHSNIEHIMIAGSTYEMIKILIEFVTPKKALLITPGAQFYDNILKAHGCESQYYALSEEQDFILDVADFTSRLTKDLDIVVISNPNCVTSQALDSGAVTSIVKACKKNGIFLVIDEKYIEFVKDYQNFTAIPLVEKYSNIAVLRNTTKFFAIPGLRLSYAVFSNSKLKKTLETAYLPYPINNLSETAGIELFRDTTYINDTNAMIHTERNLVFSALSVRKTIKLYKPAANFILVKLLKEDITAQDVVEYCMQRGLYIRSCTDIPGLSNKYIRFCFMNPKQNDLLVNTILEIV